MGQTLTHGVYLPDEGERNCYSGLAANWSILDGAVGIVAEHTSQIAGKAPLVHTHTKSDITDFPAYGNAAGTICEGNDSRLSDARTPVAHTHTKSDVTDLLNSNFIPSANNSYDLGSSSYQWNNLYAKNYYYNGTAWGLDKANVWTHNQTIASGLNDQCYYVKDTVYELGQTYSNGERLGGLTIHDKNGATVGLLDIADRSYGNTEMRIRVQQKFDPGSNNRSTSGTILFNELIIGIASNKTNYIGFNADLWGANHDLGTSTNKWKTLNGINPGALSLPDSSESATIDTTGYADSTNFYWTPPLDGWLFVNINHCSIASIKTQIGEYYINQLSGWYRNTVPVAKNKRVILLFSCSSLDVPTLTFYPCLGNV